MSKDDSPPEPSHGGGEEEEEEEEETCGFCIFMKGGGCKEAFEVGALEMCVLKELGCGPKPLQMFAGMECVRRCRAQCR